MARILLAKAAWLAFWVLVAIPLHAQEALPARPGHQEAQALFDAGEWAAAADAYRRIVGDHPEDALAWFGLGSSLHQLQRFEEALEAYAQAVHLGMDTLQVRASGGVALARLGRLDEAFEWLGRAVEHGLPDCVLRHHPGLAALREDERYAALLRRAEANRPCRRYEQTQLDFWLGEWRVVDPEGLLLGRSRVERILADCAVVETWVSRAGTQGRTTAYWHPGESRWQLLWLDDGGGVATADGEGVEGGMRFDGVHVDEEGVQELYRMTLLSRPDGSVEQRIEQSRDGGATWYVWFQGTYRPVAPGAEGEDGRGPGNRR